MENTTQQTITILRAKQLKARTGLSSSTIYLRIQDGTFPRPISLGARAVGWLESEVTEWIEERIAARVSLNDHETRHCKHSTRDEA